MHLGDILQIPELFDTNLRSSNILTFFQPTTPAPENQTREVAGPWRRIGSALWKHTTRHLPNRPFHALRDLFPGGVLVRPCGCGLAILGERLQIRILNISCLDNSVESEEGRKDLSTGAVIGIKAPGAAYGRQSTPARVFIFTGMASPPTWLQVAAPYTPDET